MSYSISQSEALFAKAQQHIPGGVNSPVRAFKGVGGTPIFFDHAKGAYVFDVDGNRYIDFVGSWGPMILGHSAPQILDAVRGLTVTNDQFTLTTTNWHKSVNRFNT